jgi:predicted RNase H-like HicB family nuclease
MRQKAERLVYPLTFVFKQEGDQWSALACEVDVASCGDTLDEAREGLKDAVELYVSYMLENGHREKVARPVPAGDLAAFCTGKHVVEYHALILDLIARPVLRLSEVRFIRSELTPVDCRYAAAER